MAIFSPDHAASQVNVTEKGQIDSFIRPYAPTLFLTSSLGACLLEGQKDCVYLQFLLFLFV